MNRGIRAQIWSMVKRMISKHDFFFEINQNGVSDFDSAMLCLNVRREVRSTNLDIGESDDTLQVIENSYAGC